MASISLLPSHRDNGHSLFCSLAYSSEFGSDLSASAPKCGYEKMDVKFGPKFTDCSEVQTFKERKRRKSRGGGSGGSEKGRRSETGKRGGDLKSKANKGGGKTNSNHDDDGDDDDDDEEDDGYYRVRCRVQANPRPPQGNFTWAFFNMTSGR